MKSLILVRAGDTAWEEDNRIQGTVPLPLVESGKKAMEAAAAEVLLHQPDVLYSSGNESSGPTASFLAKLCRLKNRKLATLREVDCGLWQGLREEEVKHRFERAYRKWRLDPTSITPPQGEGLQDACLRITRGLETLRRKNRDKTVVMVAARMVAGLIECILGGVGAEQLWRFANAALVTRVFTFRDGGGLSTLDQDVVEAGRT